MPTVTWREAEPPLVLALDAGTSSVRALLFDRRGRALANAETQLGYELVTTPDGGAEMDADRLVELLAECVDATLANAASHADEIAAVAMSCFWHSLLGLDASGKPVTPVLYWADTRSAKQVAALRAELDRREVHARTGCVIHSSYWPAKLRWLCETRPEQFRSVARWTSFADYMITRFLGVDCMSVCMASGTGMLEQRTAEWDAQMAAAVGIDPTTLPPLVDRDQPAQGLRPEFAARWPALANVPWYPPLGDGACANLGCGAVSPDRIALTLGTTGAMRIIVPAPIGQPLTIPSDLWAYRLDRQCAILGAAISNGGLLLAWMSDLLGAPLEGDDMAKAAELPPDSHGLTILPFIAGERSPIWNDRATGIIAGMTLHTRREHVLRAAMEAVAYRFARLYDAIRAVAAPDHEIAANGAAILRSPLWLQITADTLAHPLLTLPPEEEASARGAAVAALDSLGVAALGETDDPAAGVPVVPPDQTKAAAYRAGRERQMLLERLLFPDGGSWDESLEGEVMS
ncbi:MAG TPA: gluconokinase [Thermomicrobiales bacterium]